MSQSDLRSQVRSSIPWTVAMGALQIALSLVSMVLLVRYLEPEQYGIWAMLSVLPTTINLVVSFGYGESLARFVPTLTNRDEIAHIVWSVVIRRMMFGIGSSVVLILGFDLYADSFDLRPYRLHLAVTQVGVFFNLGSLYLTHAMNARFMQREIVLRTFPVQVAQVIAIAVGIAGGRELLFFVVVAVAAAFLNFAAGAWIFGLRYPPPRYAITRPSETPDQKRYRRLSYIDEWGVSFLSTDISRYLVSYFSNNVEVAIYAVATTIAARMRFLLPFTLLRPLANATFFSRYEETSDPSELRRMFGFLYDTNNLVAFLFAAVFSACGREILELIFRPEYAGAYWAGLMLIGFLALQMVPVGMVAKALQRPEILIYSKAAVVVNVALGIPLVIRYGATGMALATVLSAIVRNLIILVFLRRAIGLRMPWRCTVRAGVAALIAALIVPAVASSLPLGIEVLLVGLAYMAGVRVLAPLQSADRAVLARMLPWGHRLVPLVLGR